MQVRLQESDPEKTGHLLAMEGDELILYFKTSERVLGLMKPRQNQD